MELASDQMVLLFFYMLLTWGMKPVPTARYLFVDDTVLTAAPNNLCPKHEIQKKNYGSGGIL